MEVALALAVILAFIWGRQYLKLRKRHLEREMLHRERLLAMEKGIPLPEFPTLAEEPSGSLLDYLSGSIADSQAGTRVRSDPDLRRSRNSGGLRHSAGLRATQSVERRSHTWLHRGRVCSILPVHSPITALGFQMGVTPRVFRFRKWRPGQPRPQEENIRGLTSWNR